MKPLLTVLVAYGSWHIGARVIHRLNALPCVQVIGQSREAGDTVAQVSAARPDLVVLDLLLADGDGLGVLRALRRSWPLPVVIMTSSARNPQTRKECLREGADYFFMLPEEIDGLCLAVSELSRNVHPAGEEECL
ncbi:MAG TPA: response regulator [Bacteroidota bacterium]|nr:response regulator [Bacteroidota bacterium]